MGALFGPIVCRARTGSAKDSNSVKRNSAFSTSDGPASVREFRGRTSLFLVVNLVLLSTLNLSLLPAQDWPEFRGPNGQGHSDAVDLPLTWSEAENIVWKVPIPGQGWSSPVMRDGKIWLTTGISVSDSSGERHSLRALGSTSLRAVSCTMSRSSRWRARPRCTRRTRPPLPRPSWNRTGSTSISETSARRPSTPGARFSGRAGTCVTWNSTDPVRRRRSRMTCS